MVNHKKQVHNYTVILEKQQSGGYHAFCPALKGCHAQGKTVEESLEKITEAIELYVESLVADHQPVPEEDLIVKPLSIVVWLIPVQGKQLIQVLERLGFHFERQKGSHAIYKNVHGQRVVLPVSAEQYLNPEVFKGLIQNIGIDQETFLRLLE